MVQAEPIVFFNGELKPESQVGISIRDRGYLYGDAVFDAARTFNGTPFRLPEHVHRLYDSLRYLRIDPDMDPLEMEDWSRQVVKHNYQLLPPGQDMWVMHGFAALKSVRAETSVLRQSSQAKPFRAAGWLFHVQERTRTFPHAHGRPC